MVGDRIFDDEVGGPFETAPEGSWRAEDHPDFHVEPVQLDATYNSHQLNLLAIEAVRTRYPCRFWRRPGRKDLFELDTETGQLRAYDVDEFHAWMPRVAVVRHPNGLVKDLTYRQARTLRLYDAWPELRHVRYAPWFTADGRLVNEPGYDEETGVWLHWPHKRVADPDTVSDEVMFEVLDRLTDFRFVSEADRVAYLTACVQAVTDTRGHPSPMTLITATDQESGKTYLQDLLIAIACGDADAVSTASLPEGAERNYSLNALLQQDRPPAVIGFDNLETGSPLNSGLLNRILTARGKVEGRRTGTGDLAGGDPTASMWVGNGNGIELDWESGRRCNVVRIAPRGSMPFQTPNLLEWVRANRPTVVSALLRLVQLWHIEGRPKPKRTLGTYEWWCRNVGGPVADARSEWGEVWLSDDARPVDPPEQQLVELITKGWDRTPNGRPLPMRASDVLGAAESHALWGLIEKTEGARTRQAALTRLGKWLTALTKRDRPLLQTSPWRIKTCRDRNGATYLPFRNDGRTSNGGTEPGGPKSRTENPGTKSSRGTCGTRGTSSGPEHDSRKAAGPHHPPRGNGPTSSAGPARSADRGTTSITGSEPPPPKFRVSPSGPASSTNPRGEGDPGVGGSRAAAATRVVGIPVSDPAFDAVVAMAARGVPADPDRLQDRIAHGLTQLTGADVPTQRRRQVLVGLRQGGRDHRSALAQARETGRVRSHWTLQDLGRLQTCRPNLQGVTKLYGTREAFRAPVGRRLVVGDWRTAHLQIALAFAGETVALDALARGDLYERAAALWFPELPVEQARTVTKVCILAYLNGGSGETFARTAHEHGVDVDARTLMSRREQWLAELPRLRAFLEGLHRDPVVRLKPGLGPTRHTPIGGGPEAFRRRANAHLWQATEADAIRRVLLAMTDPVVLVVHDEVLLEVPEAEAEAAAARLQAAMHRALGEAIGAVQVPGHTLHHHYDVPPERAVKVRVAESWAEPSESREVPS